MDSAVPAVPVKPRSDWRLNAVALLGGLFHQFLVLAPVALMLMVGVIFMGGVTWSWWIAGVVLLGWWWLMQGGDPPGGHEVSREEAPVLWQDLDKLADRMRVPRLERVVLVHEANAAAVEHQDHWRLWCFHRTLVLGVPLLSGLHVDEMRAVIAHELGHFSRHFGWRGHWLYRTRLGWIRLRREGGGSAWDRAATEYARWFVPLFERLSAERAVRNEFEADALAAGTTSPAALATGLVRVQLQGQRDAPPFGEGELPRDPLGAWLPRLGDAVGAEEVHEALRRHAEWHAKQAPAEVTHPPTHERLRAVGASTEGLSLASVPPQQCAGAVWWSDRWPHRLAEENERWLAEHRRAWQLAASWRSACRARLASATVPPEVALECRLALGQAIEPPDADETDLANLPPLLTYWTGVAWLAHDAAKAQRWLEAAISRCVALAAPARRQLAAQVDDEAAQQRHALLYGQAVRRRGEARAKADRLGFAAGQPVEIEAWRQAGLTDALAGDDIIERAAWVQHEVTLTSGRSYRIVTLCLQIRLGERVPEDDIAAAYGGLLAHVVTPACVAQVRTWWTTEDWPQALLDHEQRRPDVALKLPARAAG